MVERDGRIFISAGFFCELNYYLYCTFYEGRLQGQVNKFLILSPSFLIRCCVEPLGQTTLFEHNISIEKRRREKKR